MSGHESDCAMCNAPAMAPGACTCGAAPTFKVFRYDITNDRYKWLVETRETMISRVVSTALAQCYGHQERVLVSTLIRRAIQDGLTPAESAAVKQAWDREVTRDEVQCEQHGYVDHIVNLDLSPLPSDVRVAISETPEIGEVRSVMAPWFEYWGTRPERVRGEVYS